MINIKKKIYAVPIVIISGLIWSFGPLVVRNIDEPNILIWQYLFARGLTIFLILNLYLFYSEGKKFYKNYLNTSLSSFVGGTFLGFGMICFIVSITNTSAAITLLCLAAMPFVTALLGFFLLKEIISLKLFFSIIVASVGIVIMSLDQSSVSSKTGLVFGLLSAFCFAIFSVSLRWKKKAPTFSTVAFAGLACVIMSLLVIIINDFELISSLKNQFLFSLHGILVCSGLILYSIGSRFLPAAELALLSLIEVVGGVLWVWLPIFGINEVPSYYAIVGGSLIVISIIFYSYIIKKNSKFVLFN
jgi:DME family drug/metabolite transporter|tara:strand:+ start:913 stop:1818 length:906 start_codon:yes stop_codon:yes gene_type:complete